MHANVMGMHKHQQEIDNLLQQSEYDPQPVRSLVTGIASRLFRAHVLKKLERLDVPGVFIHKIKRSWSMASIANKVSDYCGNRKNEM